MNEEGKTDVALLGSDATPGTAGPPSRDKRALLCRLSLALGCSALLGGYLIALTLRDQRFLDTGGQSPPRLAIPIYVALAIAGEAQSLTLLLVAVAIRLESKGPALFRQVGVGHGNRQFRIYKFRSMRDDASDPSGDRSTSRDDDRINRAGRLIRRTSTDEIPHLLNVLKGDMRLVGPRPHALGSLAGTALFWKVNDGYWINHALKPGIKGLAQIRGFRGPTDKSEDLEQRLRCDLEYFQNWSIGDDFVILLETLRVVVYLNAF